MTKSFTEKAMADTETMSKKNEEKKRIRKRVKTAGKKPKKAKKKVTVEDSQATIDKMVGEDFIKDTTNHPDKVATLVNKTELSEVSIRSQYDSFMKECPTGEMEKSKFVELSEIA